MNIEKKIDDLTIEKWGFYYLNGSIFLDSYLLMHKKTKRHKYQVLKRYDRITGRSNSIREKDVILTDDIKQEALSLFVSNLKVIKWSEK